MLSPVIFRAYDIRGKYGEDIDSDGMLAIGKAIGTYMKEKNLKNALVSRDTRPSGIDLQAALIEGLVYTGIEVSKCPETSFGVSVFTAKKEDMDGCFYITASHLPPEYNGVKPFYGSGLSFSSGSIEHIGRIATRGSFVKGEEKEVKEINAKKEYLKFMEKNFDCSGMKAAIDCGGASTCLIAPELFKTMKIKTENIFCEPDPTLSVRDLRPSTETLGTLIDTVKEGEFDFGVGFDGDGDRAVLVDEKGGVLLPDHVGVIIGKELLKEETDGVIVANVECSMLPDRVLAPLGAKIVRVPVGHTHIMEAGYEHKAIFAYEASGHMAMPRVSLSDDAMLSVLKLAEIIKKSDKTLSEMVSELPALYRTRVMFRTTEKDKFNIVEEVKKKLLCKYGQITAIDGVRVDKEHGWALIRASNTSPVVRLTVEADSMEELGNIRQEFMNGMMGYSHSFYETSF